MYIGNDQFIELCRKEVAKYYNNRKDKTDETADMKPEDVFVVWCCKTLQNHKALLSTPVSDGMYYEMTYNGDAAELYMDAYKKWENVCIDVVKCFE